MFAVDDVTTILFADEFNCETRVTFDDVFTITFATEVTVALGSIIVLPRAMRIAEDKNVLLAVTEPSDNAIL